MEILFPNHQFGCAAEFIENNIVLFNSFPFSNFHVYKPENHDNREYGYRYHTDKSETSVSCLSYSG
jgi:hypothetical protein